MMFALRSNSQLVMKGAMAFVRQQRTLATTFSAAAIEVQRTTKPMPKPNTSSSLQLAFGKTFSDHMFVARWTTANGWETPKIKPLEFLEIHPCAKALHYAQEIFEGMKAYRGVDGYVRLFRPKMNAKRMLRSAARAGLPSYDPDEYIDCIKRIVKEDADWVPQCDPNDLSRSPTLYIRPFMIGTEPTLGVAASSEVLFMIVVGPVGPYFPTGFKPVSLYADPSLVRSWPGGTGFTKMGCNYAPTMTLQNVATENGCQQVLWLFGKENYITEVGSMNMFAVLRDKAGKLELVTPPVTNGLILPGVTRDSIIELARDWHDVTISEREITLDELLELNQQKRLVEMFGSGTACIVCPVSEIVFNGKRHRIVPVKDGTSLTQRAVTELTGIQFGQPDMLKKKPHWVVPVC